MLVDWLAAMINKDLPADEICIHACGTYLDVHIPVDYHFGVWTTLNVPDISHDLAVALSDVHLAYMGSCTYNYLC